MLVVSQILALFTSWSLDEEKNVTTPPPAPRFSFKLVHEWSCYDAFIINIKYISKIVLMFSLLNLNK